VSITSFSSHTSEARGLKIGMHNPYMDGSKVTIQFLIFCLEAKLYSKLGRLALKNFINQDKGGGRGKGLLGRVWNFSKKCPYT